MSIDLCKIRFFIIYITGNLVIPNSLATLGNDAFKHTNIEKIFIKVNSEDKVTDYRKSIIDALPTKSKTIIDTQYDFDISKTWLEDTDKVIAKPVVKNLVDGVESELVDGKGEKVSLYIPSIYEESNITVLKDGKVFNLPIKNNDDKYIFTEEGNYKVTINTSLGNVSVINFEVNNEVINIDKENPKIDYKLSTEDLTNENVTITVNASDNVEIEKIILPDNSEVNVSTTTYEVSQNGAYEFIAVDKSGNRKNIIVKVNNIDKESPKIDYKLSTEDLTNENVTISVNASDNVGIEKIILPDNSEVNASTTTYEVSQNGDYEFITVDKSGNRKNIIVNISNIDKESPLVSYKIIKDNEDSVIVEFEMKDSLSGINSIINDKGLTSLDGNKFELMKNVQYTFTVTDNAGNTNTINILEKKEDNLVESLPKIDGLEFVQGNGTKSNPLQILIQKDEGIKTLFSELDNRFEYNIVGKMDTKDGYKIYQIELNDKTVVANEQAKNNKNSSYIEIKVNERDTELIAKLDKIFIKNDEDSNEGNGSIEVKPSLIENKLIGEDRYKTAIKVSNRGWSQSDNVVIVNSSAIVDALSATPFAKMKNAPILLTEKDKLNNETKKEITRLGAKNIYVIGGTGVVSESVTSQLKSMNLNVDRISGDDRYSTSLEIAKRLSNVSEIAVVNGVTGLADAVSIAPVAADRNIPIVLASPNEGTKVFDEYIKNNNIKTSYVIGGEAAISKDIASKLPNANRLGGSSRNETNAIILEKFYTNKDLNNIFVTKNGMKKADDLIDALAVGVLASKENSPVVIVGDKLDSKQEELLKYKTPKEITQVGGNGNENAFSQIVNMFKR